MKSRPTVLFLLLVFLCVCAAGQTKLTVEQVMSSPFPTALTMASQTGRIAWVFDLRGERNIWVADAPAYKARQVTHYQGDNGQDIASVRLTPDGRTVVYARGGETGERNYIPNPTTETKAPKQQVWAADVESGQPKLLGDMGCEEEGCEDIQLSPDGQSAVWAGKHHLWLAAISGNAAGDKPARQLDELKGDESDAQWSPDGQHIAFRSNRGDHSFIAVYDLATSRVRYLAPAAERDLAPRWSPDGKQLVFLRTPGVQMHLPLIPVRPTPWSIWLADAQSGTARQIWHSSSDMDGSLPPFATESLKVAAGGVIVFCSEQDGRNHLYAVRTGGGEARLLTPGDFDVEDVTLSGDGRTLFYTSNQNDIERRHIWRIDLPTGKSQPVTQGTTVEWNPVVSDDGKNIFCFGSTATSPAMPYRVTANGREMIAGDVLPADFPSAQLVEPQTVTFRADDGLAVHGQLFVPRNKPAKTAALIFVHGGPPRQMLPAFHYMQYYHNAYAENQYLASLGYVVLSVNYRLGIMYGRAFRQPANGGWRGSSEYKDVLAGARYLQSLPYVDAKKIGIWGGSYGGLLTALALARNSDIFAAGVDFHGVHDWSLLRNRDAMDAPDYQEANKLAFDSSPVASVDRWRSPVLLIHGDDDRNVPFTQTTDLAQRLKKQSVQFEEIIFPDEIHDFLLWRTWIRGYQATADFFQRKLPVQ